MGSAKNRTAFVKTVIDLAKNYSLDGLNFEYVPKRHKTMDPNFKFSWEYPTKSGVGCNTMNLGDTANFLLFLQELRQDPHGSKLILSASTPITPFAGPDGNPLSDVSGFAKVLDYIEIMNYDVWGSWSPTVGPNAPLNDTCAATQNRVGSAVSAVQTWHAAGFPLRQIVLGVASYGHSFKVNKTDAFEPGSMTLLAPYPRFNSSAHPKGDSWDSSTGVDVCGNVVFPGGTIDFWGLIQLGYLNPNGTLKQGIFFRYDNCSQTVRFSPFLRVVKPSIHHLCFSHMCIMPRAKSWCHTIMLQYVFFLKQSSSFGDITSFSLQSFAAKGKFILDTKLRGFSIWESGGDSNHILLNSIREAGGYN